MPLALFLYKQYSLIAVNIEVICIEISVILFIFSFFLNWSRGLIVLFYSIYIIAINIEISCV